jgi:hypothetical protein
VTVGNNTRDVSESAFDEINEVQVLEDSAALESCFERGLRQDLRTDESEDEQENQEEGLGEADEDERPVVDNVKTRPSLTWADKFIFETRRKGGRQTENSVLKLWKVCGNLLLKELNFF